MFKILSGLPGSTNFSTFLGQRMLIAGKRRIDLQKELIDVQQQVCEQSKSALKVAAHATAGGVALGTLGLGTVIGAIAGGMATSSKQTITFIGKLSDGTVFTAQADQKTFIKIVSCITKNSSAKLKPPPVKTAPQKPLSLNDFSPIGRREECTFSTNYDGKINARCNSCGDRIVVLATKVVPFKEGFQHGYRILEPVKCKTCGVIHKQINKL